tara:strand:- start:39514 stop:40008 length:495 start_codon:yes stop_codon:yes gene_type:complete
MNSIKKLYNKAADHVRANKNTAIFAAVFGAISTFQVAPAVLSNPSSNIIQETAFLATTGAAKTGILYAGFLLGAAGYGAARRKGYIKNVENDQLWSSVSSSVGAMVLASCTFNGVNMVASPLLAYEDTNPSQQQYAAIDAPQATKGQDGRIVSYDAKANVLTIA